MTINGKLTSSNTCILFEYEPHTQFPWFSEVLPANAMVGINSPLGEVAVENFYFKIKYDEGKHILLTPVYYHYAPLTCFCH
jgi:hypothetical protein